ncbi:VanZ family protein [Acetivibrio cellulolyticus]|uniref:VanZ family protein n=1 Tax=Acetivibrio cellulolyticus TaxID=35830 RepID=UPI0001E2F092|nr:VanZ family protein [Acetivibrio cellulolyticus]
MKEFEIVTKKWVRLVSVAALTGYLAYLFYLTFFSSYFGRDFTRREIKFLPFVTIIHFFTSSDVNSFIVNIFGNIAAFVPMGFLLPIVVSRVNNLKRVALAAFFASLFIEITQYIGWVGTSDVDDLILNVLGGVLGYGIYRMIRRIVIR